MQFYDKWVLETSMQLTQFDNSQITKIKSNDWAMYEDKK
jgi:hypothetical protein